MHVTFLHRSCALVVVLLPAMGLIGCHSSAERDVARAVGAPAAATPSQAGLRGDLNGNGLPDVADAIAILRVVVGLGAADARADCDRDGSTGVADAIIVLRCLVGISVWPIGSVEPNPGDTVVGPDGQTLVWVPTGSLLMGSEDGYDEERPAHQVTLNGFWIGKYEVTNAQYRAFCEATGRAFPADSNAGDDHPVVSVSWSDAQAYCEHHDYALPTEAQWEYAARGPDVPRYPWGNDWDAQKCCSVLNPGPGGKTFAVGSFPAGASWCGALDMAGNVWEWCADWYLWSYYQVSPGLDPPGPASGSTRVVRGGSWSNIDTGCRAAGRYGLDPAGTHPDGGFRVSWSGS